jgi:protein-tyrosine phosphatase
MTGERFSFLKGMPILKIPIWRACMISILFVCHGNICRSPMAEFVMKKLVDDAGKADEFYIESAATSTEEIGNPVYPPARRMLQKHGIHSDGKTARQMTVKDLETFDYIILMDENNLRNLKWILPRSILQNLNISNDPSGRRLQKVSLLMDYTDEPREVADPWYTGDFQATWDDVWDGCSELLKFLKPHFSK